MVPVKTPKEIVQALHKAALSVMSNPDIEKAPVGPGLRRREQPA